MNSSCNYYHDNNYNNVMFEWLESFSFKAMLTIKFYNYMSNGDLFTQLEKVMRNFNMNIYGKNYIKKKIYNECIFVIEKNKIKLKEKKHVHILLRSDGKIDKFSAPQLLDICVKSSIKLKDKKGRAIFQHNKPELKYNSQGASGIGTGCMHVIEIYSNNALKYVSKEVTKLGNEVKFMRYGGLSDTDMVTTINSSRETYYLYK